MHQVLLLYTSMTGNTEIMAESIAEEIQKNPSISLTIADISVAPHYDITKFNGLIIGSYTYWDGEIPDEFLDLYENIEDLQLSGKMVGLFGSGDRYYDKFCGALDLFERKLNRAGVTLPIPPLKVDLTPGEEEKEKCVQFAADFLKALLKQNLESVSA